MIKKVISRRIFFALWPDQQTRDHITRVFRQAPQAKLPGRKLHKNNLHITLHFLGNVSASTFDCVEKIAETLKQEAFQFNLDKFGAFSRARVFWSGLTDIPDELLLLQDSLGQLLKQCDYCPEKRPYTPHVTLMRKVKCGEENFPHETIVWRVNRFALVESISVADGVEYRPLRFYDLK